MPRGGPVGDRSICWDCENACCGCSWSRWFEPVEGWTAKPVVITQCGGKTPTYLVYACPEFKRDAVNYGLKWAYKPNTIIHREYKKKGKSNG